MLRWIKRLAIAALAVAALAVLAMTAYAHLALPVAGSSAQFTLKSGSSLRSAARQMADAGVLGWPVPFEILGRALGESSNIKAGNYDIALPLTPLGLLAAITRGSYTLDALTLVEGWSLRQVRLAVDKHPALRHDTAGLSDAELAQRLQLPDHPLEGWLFPETYHFSAGSSDLQIFKRAHELMRGHLQAQWDQRAAGLPYQSPYEALIMASIVEKETGRPADRTQVAAVFVNRLRLGMKLQTDPTVIYGLGEAFDGNLRKRDLMNDTPYNTYTRGGMPPTPIAMPGLASIQAALNPAKSDALYFVARGDGSSHFSRSLDEHERAVTRYQRGGRR